jgi:hypothetical protein
MCVAWGDGMMNAAVRLYLSFPSPTNPRRKPMHAVRTWITAVILSIASMAALVPMHAAAQANPGTNPGAPPPVPAGDGTFLLTIFLKHDQSKPLHRKSTSSWPSRD